MVEIIKAQQGRITKPEQIKLGKFRFGVKSGKNGIVRKINNTVASRVARIAGAPLNKGAGIYLCKNVSNRVRKGEVLFTVYAESKQKLDYAKDVLKEENPFVVR